MTRQNEPNRMIVIDGVDGGGKGVQSRRLLEALRRAGHPAILTREPGGSPAAEEIRQLLVAGDPEKWDAMTELMLMYAARRAHLRDTIWPALARGDWVISDRFADSSRAFQGIAGKLGLEQVEAVHRIVVGDFEPELVLVLDVPEAIALQRARERGGSEDRFERKGSDYHAAVRAAFLQIARDGGRRYVVIDAEQEMDAVSAAILEVVRDRFELALEPCTDIR